MVVHMCNLQLQFIVKLLKIANETGRVEFGVVISLSLSLSLSLSCGGCHKQTGYHGQSGHGCLVPNLTTRNIILLVFLTRVSFFVNYNNS